MHVPMAVGMLELQARTYKSFDLCSPFSFDCSRNSSGRQHPSPEQYTERDEGAVALRQDRYLSCVCYWPSLDNVQMNPSAQLTVAAEETSCRLPAIAVCQDRHATESSGTRKLLYGLVYFGATAIIICVYDKTLRQVH